MPKVTRAQRKATANFLDRLANAKRKHGDEEYANAAERQAQINRGTCECCGVKRVYVHPEHGQHYLCKTCSDEQIQLADDMWR